MNARDVVEGLAALRPGGTEVSREWLAYQFNATEVEAVVGGNTPGQQHSRLAAAINQGWITDRGGYFAITLGGLKAHPPGKRWGVDNTQARSREGLAAAHKEAVARQRPEAEQ